MLWVGPLALILAIAGMSYWVYRGGRAFVLHRISIVAAMAAIAGLVGVIIGPLVRPGILSLADDVSSQTLLGNLYNAFMDPFTIASWIVFGVGLLIAITFAGLHAFTKGYAVEVKVRRK